MTDRPAADEPATNEHATGKPPEDSGAMLLNSEDHLAARELVRKAERARAKRRAAEPGRGRDAAHPRDIPWTGWKDILYRSWHEIGNDSLGLISAGVAFYWMLALFPGMSALISLYGLVADPADVHRQVAAVAFLLPDEMAAIVTQQLTAVTNTAPTSLGFGFVVSISITTYSATRGTKAIMQALNIAYEEEERRGLIRRNLVALSLTLSAILVFMVALAAIVLIPILLSALWLDFAAGWAVLVGRWILLALVVTAALALVYRVAPNRRPARLRWIWPGALVATLLWLAGSLLFAWYVAAFGSFNETYGSIGAVIVMLMWLFYSAFIVLLGAEFNSEMEHQTAVDTCVGRERPMGKRGAFVADSLGPRWGDKG